MDIDGENENREMIASCQVSITRILKVDSYSHVHFLDDVARSVCAPCLCLECGVLDQGGGEK